MGEHVSGLLYAASDNLTFSPSAPHSVLAAAAPAGLASASPTRVPSWLISVRKRTPDLASAHIAAFAERSAKPLKF